MSAVVAASASAALPEYKVCVKAAKSGKLYLGKYTDKVCATVATKAQEEAGKENKYERGAWNLAKKLAFKGKGTNAVNQIINPITKKVEGATECAKEASVGEITGPKTEKLTVTWSKCKALGKNCESPAAGKGIVKTNPLVGELVYLDKAHTKVGVKISPETGVISAEYNCEGQKVVATGAVIGESTGQVNTISNTHVDTFAHATGEVGQQWAYVEEQGTSKQELQYYTWGYAFKACVKEKMEKGDSQAEAEGICFGEKGPWETYPNKPINIFSILSGAVEAEAPSTQNTVNTTKGEKEMMEA